MRLGIGWGFFVGAYLRRVIGGGTFAPDGAAIGGGGAPLSTGGEVAVGLSGFSE